jgi:hypothetical protein
MKGALPEYVRLKGNKHEPAHRAIAERVVPEGFCRLFEQKRPRIPNPPVAAYIDIARLQTVLAERDPYKLCGGVISRTVACLGVGMIAEGRPWGYPQGYAYTHKEFIDERNQRCTETKATVGYADGHRDRYPIDIE